MAFNRVLLVSILVAIYSCLLLQAFSPRSSRTIGQRPVTAKQAKNQHLLDVPWYPSSQIGDDDKEPADAQEEQRLHDLEIQSTELMASLINYRLRNSTTVDLSNAPDPVQECVRGRFLDLACTIEGEQSLENLFGIIDTVEYSIDTVRGAVMALQSLCVMATQTGVTGDPEVLERQVRHLNTNFGNTELLQDLKHWNRDSIRRLKYRHLDRAPAVQLLAELLWKRSPQGALELLQKIGAYDLHEDLALLRSGFPIRFEAAEEQAAIEAAQRSSDPDAALGIRKDLRHLKVFTVDSADTLEIDDGLSVELVEENGIERQALYIHIADADRWAPRDSSLLATARARLTSLYLPQRTIQMFPSEIVQCMSLKANQDTCALSLRVLVNEDGSIDESSIQIYPSIIKVTYRLTYDDVDEMLSEGIGYQEEWELGALLHHAKLRREYRMNNGSSEGFIPNPIPQVSAVVRSGDGNDTIDLNVEVSHNAGSNYSSSSNDNKQQRTLVEIRAVSSAYLLVTEAMILAGEAVGTWQAHQEKDSGPIPNKLRLPFRTQKKPDWKSRRRERIILRDLLEYNVGNGLCHAWYGRRFFEPALIGEKPAPHFGLGIARYVQWSSPIRRFSDLQAHAAIKRYLRRQKVNTLLSEGGSVPDCVSSSDLGIPCDTIEKGHQLDEEALDQDINFLEGVGLYGVARQLQRKAQQYWILEHIRRLQEQDPDFVFTAIVLGCVDPVKSQFAIYVEELALEHKYTSPTTRGRIEQGTKLLLRVDRVSPAHGLLSFVTKV